MLLALVAAALAGAPSLSAAANAALAACLADRRWTLDAGHLSASPAEAPGLPPGSLIARVPTSDGRLFVYQDDDHGRVIRCGVAVYGAAGGVDLAATKRRIVSGDASLRPASPDFWNLSASRPGVQRFYWGGAAPGLYGVMLLQAPSSPDSPTLQVDRHSILVQ